MSSKSERGRAAPAGSVMTDPVDLECTMSGAVDQAVDEVRVLTEFDAGGRPTGMVALTRDVTTRDHAEEEILARQRLALPVEQTPLAVVEFDLNHLVYGSSRAWTVEAAREQQATGLRTFNAAVTAGRPADAYVFTEVVHQRWPQVKPDFLWLLDVEAFLRGPLPPSLLAESKFSRYLPWRAKAAAQLDELGWVASWTGLKAPAVQRGAVSRRAPPAPRRLAIDGGDGLSSQTHGQLVDTDDEIPTRDDAGFPVAGRCRTWQAYRFAG